MKFITLKGMAHLKIESTLILFNKNKWREAQMLYTAHIDGSQLGLKEEQPNLQKKNHSTENFFIEKAYITYYCTLWQSIVVGCHHYIPIATKVIRVT